ncbi:HCL572Cp [Eremothecium sinecaudum]|uniref:HCL572Cp n=1 Tax=Eremothecium sinecaudum TaxID=45286 RepID=A0A120K1N7_9SACH|nr:HCL572Cp [Eremothecium sinecaudum]AMD19579.1 HCL572Cp [Eremothecium sinecaudum]
MDKSSKNLISNPGNDFLTTELLARLYKRLLSGWEYRKVKIRDDHRYKLEHPSRLERRNITKNEVIAISANAIGSLAAWTRADGSISIMNAITKRHYFTINDAHGKDRICLSLAWNPVEADQFATVGNSTTVKVWTCSDTKNPSFKSFFTGPRMKNSQCVFDPFGKWLLVLTKTDELYLFDVLAGYQLHSISKLYEGEESELGERAGTACSICWLNDGRHIAIGSKNGAIRMLKLCDKGFEEIHMITGHLDEISSLVADPWGLYLVAGSHDGSCSVWSLKDYTCKHVFADFKGLVENVSISNDGFLLSVSSRQASKGTSNATFLSLNSYEKLYEHTFKDVSHALVCFIPEGLKILVTDEKDTIILLKSGCRSILHIQEEVEEMEENVKPTVLPPAAKEELRKASKRRRSEKLRSIDRSKEANPRVNNYEEPSRPMRGAIERNHQRRDEGPRYRRDRAITRHARDDFVVKRY